MGFLQNNYMKRLYKHLQGIILAEDFRLAMSPVPKELLSVSSKNSDSMVIVYSNENVAAYFFFGSNVVGDSFIFGTATNNDGTWEFAKNDAVFTPFSTTDSASECLALFVELVTAVSMRDYLDISEDAEEIGYFESMLEENFGITDEDSYRQITVKVIKEMGERIPELSLGSKFVY